MSLLPICTCKQKANHAASLCILKQSNKPTATWMPGLPAQGWPACREDEGLCGSGQGHRSASQPPPGDTYVLPQNHPGGVCAAPDPAPRIWAFPSFPPGMPVPLALPPGYCPGLPPSPAARLQAEPPPPPPASGAGLRLPGGAPCPRGEPPSLGGGHPSARPLQPPARPAEPLFYRVG